MKVKHKVTHLKGSTCDEYILKALPVMSSISQSYSHNKTRIDRVGMHIFCTLLQCTTESYGKGKGSVILLSISG